MTHGTETLIIIKTVGLFCLAVLTRVSHHEMIEMNGIDVDVYYIRRSGPLFAIGKTKKKA